MRFVSVNNKSKACNDWDHEETLKPCVHYPIQGTRKQLDQDQYQHQRVDTLHGEMIRRNSLKLSDPCLFLLYAVLTVPVTYIEIGIRHKKI